MEGERVSVSRRRGKRREPKPVIGWREWVALPELGIAYIKPKIDTGARSSSLHVSEIEEFRRGEALYVRFKVHPIQRNREFGVRAEAEVLEYRKVKSSNGKKSLRPVILTDVKIFDQRWPIELTLADRDEMGFRMLLGREAVRGRFLVDPGRSFVGGRPLAKSKKKKRSSSGPSTRGGRRRPSSDSGGEEE
jgi:hypothetical protein